MKLIRPEVQVWEQGYTLDDIYAHIARCTRVCYQTEKKHKGEDDTSFVLRTIIANKHYAMLEHGTVYLYVPFDAINEFSPASLVFPEPYNRVYTDDAFMGDSYVTTNMRFIMEHELEAWLQFICEPSEHHIRRKTISFITNIGVSREFNRHRVNSIAEESTRYCNYSKNKFGNQITFVKPTWIPDTYVGEYTKDTKFSEFTTDIYLKSLVQAEETYFDLLLRGWTPQEAREVLPLATKTQVVHTAFVDDWKHFFLLRASDKVGRPHPNAKEIAELAQLMTDIKLDEDDNNFSRSCHS